MLWHSFRCYGATGSNAAIGRLQRLLLLRFNSQHARAFKGKDSPREIFVAPASNSRQVLAYIGAATQILFWGNLSQWAATGYAVKDKYFFSRNYWLTAQGNGRIRTGNSVETIHICRMAGRYGFGFCIYFSFCSITARPFG